MVFPGDKHGLLLVLGSFLLELLPVSQSTGQPILPQSTPLKQSSGKAMEVPLTSRVVKTGTSNTIQEIPSVDKLEFYDECQGKTKEVQDHEMILITSNPTPESYTCEQAFVSANATFVLEVQCHSLELRFSCKFESLQFQVDSRTFDVCRSNATPVKLVGHKIALTYKRTVFGVHGGYTCSIITNSIVHPATLVSPCGISLVEQERAIRSSLAPRVVNGEEVKKSNFPWMAIVKMDIRDETFTCGGTLISSQAVLTAAHCLTNSKEVKVGLGTLTSLEEESKDSVWITSSNISKYPSFDEINIVDDIAIIYLPERLSFTDKILPICLPTVGFHTDLSEFKATVLGWGALYYGGPMPNQLQKAELSIWEQDKCRESWKKLSVTIQDTQMCALGATSDTCTGDSGGPLMIKTEGRWVLVGITSYGYECSSKKLPGVYTRVSEYTAWISSLII